MRAEPSLLGLCRMQPGLGEAKRQQLHDIAAQIQSTVNTRRSFDDMNIVAKVKGSDVIWIEITPWQMAGRFCETIFTPEDILAFASVYNLRAHFSANYDYDSHRAIPSLCMFPNEKIED